MGPVAVISGNKPLSAGLPSVVIHGYTLLRGPSGSVAVINGDKTESGEDLSPGSAEHAGARRSRGPPDSTTRQSYEGSPTTRPRSVAHSFRSTLSRLLPLRQLSDELVGVPHLPHQRVLDLFDAHARRSFGFNAGSSAKNVSKSAPDVIARASCAA